MRISSSRGLVWSENENETSESEKKKRPARFPEVSVIFFFLISNRVIIESVFDPPDTIINRLT
jgi:hypothetical protein